MNKYIKNNNSKMALTNEHKPTIDSFLCVPKG